MWGLKPRSPYLKIFSNVPFESSIRYSLSESQKTYRTIFRISTWRSYVRILQRAIFFQSEKPGFLTVIVKNRHKIRFLRPRITHFCSRFPDESGFHRPFSERPIFRTSLYTFPDTPCTWEYDRKTLNCSSLFKSPKEPQLAKFDQRRSWELMTERWMGFIKATPAGPSLATIL